jgi:carboxypeptidase family protein
MKIIRLLSEAVGRAPSPARDAFVPPKPARGPAVDQGVRPTFAARALAVILTLATAAHAQTSRGTVSGSVTDPSGAVVTRASIVLTHTETGVRLSAATNEAGIYRFDAVDLGKYELRVAHPGFNAFLATELGVEANRTTVLDVRLEVGSEATAVRVSAEAEELTVRDGPLRGGNFLSNQVSQLPLISLSPISLALTLPGVVRPSGGVLWGKGDPEATQFSVNGQRVRGNNFLLDGTENNDMAMAGVAQPFNIADAVEEVSVQTGNFSVEFGRAAGGVLNVVTKSGTNSVHGTAFWRYQSQRFNSVSNLDKLNGTPKSVFVRNLPGFTAGGPVHKDKTFFFAGFQQDTLRSTANIPLVVPTAAAVDRLRSLFPSNPRLDLYLNTLADLRGTAAPISLLLGADPQTGLNRGSVQFATAPLSLPQTAGGPEWLVRFDHHWSEAHRLSWRYIYDSRSYSPAVTANPLVYFPGFSLDAGARNQNFLFTDSYTFGPTYTHEFRFSYGRMDTDQARIPPGAAPLASTLPQITITNIAAPGVPSNFLEFRHANNLLFQETQTKLSGRHIFRYGMELLKQLATQQPGAYTQGEIDYRPSPGYSAFANFLDDFSGQPGRIRRTIGATTFHPSDFRQSYFFQDSWKTTPSLTLTLGMRYENFGQPANALRYPAFTGFDPDLFFRPNHVNTDNKDFGPAFGLAWSPRAPSLSRLQWLSRLLGDHKTVLRGGYQISYQELYTQILSLDLATSTPNAISIDQTALAPGRGDPNWFAQLPAATPRTPSILDTQYGTLEKNFRNPYTERWSFGFQRQLRGQSLLDVSYVGAESHKLTTRADLNPLQPSGVRLHPDFGPRTARTSEGNSAYHSLQARLDRRFAHGLQFATSYTWSKSLDSTSEGIGQVNTQGTNANVTSVPIAQGGLKLDQGLSDFDRGQRLTFNYLWEIPGPSRGWWKQALGGWSIAGITTFQSGTPYTIKNSTDRNRDGWLADRPDISNPNAPRNSRASRMPSCATGYQNPEGGVCVNPADVYWVEGTGFPNASTVGRNTLFTNGTNNFDASLLKTFTIAERKRLEFRWEAQNAFNHPQFVQVPQRDVVNTPAGRFLNRDFTDSGIRSMWVQVKLLF